MMERVSACERARQEAESHILNSVEAIPEHLQKKYAKAPEVGIAIKVISISHLDMADNTFMADFNVNVAWKGEKDDKVEVQIYNAMSMEEPEEGEVKKAEAGFDFYYRIRYKGTFRQQYNLRDFPFDSQELTVRVRLKSECKLVHLPWSTSGASCSMDPGAIDPAFSLDRAEVRHVYLPSYKFGKLGGYDPEALVVFCVDRQPDYWVNNFGVLMSIVATFCLAAFALSAGDVGDRLGIGFTLNLTVVATFYLMGDKLPSVSYWTKLEEHMVFCIFFTMIVMVINCMPAIVGEELMTKLERVLFPGLTLAWIGYHFWVKMQIEAIKSKRNVRPVGDVKLE